MKTYYNLLLFLFLTFPCLILAANSDNPNKITLDSNISYVVDEGFDPLKVVKGEYDHLFNENSSGKPIIVENSLDSTWFKIDIDTTIKLLKSDFYLIVTSGLIYQLDLYYLDQNNEMQRQLQGASYKPGVKKIQTVPSIFYISDLSKNYKNVYLKMKTDGVAQIVSIMATDGKTALSFVEKENLFFGFKYGAILIILILNLFYFSTTKNKIFLFYSIYIIFSGITSSLVDNTLSVLSDNSISIALHLTIIPLFYNYLPLMAFKFLELDPKKHKILYRCSLGLVAASILMSIDGILIPAHHAIIFKYGALLFLISFVLLIICIIKGIRKNKFVGFGFFIGIIILITGMTLATLHSYGIISISYGRELAGIAVILELTILSLTLAIRFSKIELVAEERKSEVLRLETANKEMKMKAYSSQMNPHFLFNSLNSIQRMYVEGNSEKANDYLSDFSALLRQTLNNTSKEFVSMLEDIKMLKHYLELERIRTGGQLSYEIHIDEDINPVITQIPPLIIQPFVENAIWHGILPTGSKGKIEIQFTPKKDGVLNCIITDDGIGYYTSQKNKKNSSHESKGIKIAQKRLEITDAVTIEEPESGGTRVSLKIPYETAPC